MPVPATRSLVARTARVDALRTSLAERALTALVAPAGYGKTSLLALALAEHLPAAWYTAQLWHAGDFAEPLAHEVRRVRPGFGRLTLALAVRRPEGGPARARAAWAQHLGATFAAELSHVAEPLAVVFEDVHLLADDSAFAEFVVGLMRALPDHVHLVLGGRSLPPLPLAEWLAQGRARFFGTEELRFDEAEIVELARGHGLAIDASHAAVLRMRFEGWATGLALQFATGDRPVPTEAGSLPASSAYLIEANLSALEPGLVEFLEQTAVLETMYASQLERDETLGNVRAHLHELERRGVMLGVVDPGEVYRVHPLLREALLARLRARAGAPAVEARHRWAGDLFERAGRPVAALYHLESGGDRERLAAFLKAYAYELFIAGHGERAGKASRSLRVAGFDDPVVSGQLEGMLLRQRGDPSASKRFAAALVAARSAGDVDAESTLRFLLTEDRLARGEALARAELEELLALARRRGPRAEVDALTFAGWSRTLDGAFGEARELARAAFALAENDLVALTRVASLDAYAAICLGRLEEAEALMSRTLRLLEGSDHVVLLANTLVWCARFALLSGDAGAAKDYAEAGERLSRKLDLPAELAGAELALAEVCAHEGDRAACERAAQAAASAGRAAWYYADRERSAALGALFIARALFRSDGAAAALAAARTALAASAPPAQRATQLSEAAAYAALAGEEAASAELAALAARTAGTAKAVDALDALAIMGACTLLGALARFSGARGAEAPPGGTPRGAAEAPPGVPAPILATYGPLIARHGEAADGAAEPRGKRFESELLRALRREPRRSAATAAEPRGSALTRRESEILELLVQGLSNKEIAQRIVVSPRTVDTHVERVLSKLGAATRARAVAVALRNGMVAAI